DIDTLNIIAIIYNIKQTEILEGYPTIQAKDQTSLLEGFKQMIDGKKVVAMSGSLTKGLEADFYKKLIDMAKAKGLTVILDTSGPALEAALDHSQPSIIKPNESELAALTDGETAKSEQIIASLQTDQFKDMEV